MPRYLIEERFVGTVEADCKVEADQMAEDKDERIDWFVVERDVRRGVRRRGGGDT